VQISKNNGRIRYLSDSSDFFYIQSINTVSTPHDMYFLTSWEGEELVFADSLSAAHTLERAVYLWNMANSIRVRRQFIEDSIFKCLHTYN
jgi:hypothetical protein